MAELQLWPSQFALMKDSGIVPRQAYIGGRGSGKSHVGALWSIKQASANPGSVGLCLAPTHNQAIKIQLKNITNHLNSFKIKWTYGKKPKFKISTLEDHKGILSIDIAGSEYATQIAVGSAINFDHHRGQDYAWIWFDEARDIEEEAIDVLLATLRGYGDGVYPVLVTTTPNGYDYVYKQFCVNDEDQRYYRACSAENKSLPKKFIDDLRKKYSDKFFQQEVMGEFVDMNSMAACYAWNREHCVKTIKPPNDAQLFYSFDFNVAPMCFVAGWRWKSAGKTKIHISHESIQRDSAQTRRGVQYLLQDVRAPVIEIFGDATGNSRSTRSTSSDFDIIRSHIQLFMTQAGEKCNIRVRKRVPKANPRQRERINSMNKIIEDGCFTIDPSCELTIEHITEARLNDKGEIDKKYLDPHAYDAVTYAVYGITGTKPGTSYSIG